MPSQHTHIIHKPPNQLLVLVDLATLGELALSTDFLGGNLDLEFVFLVRFRR